MIIIGERINTVRKSIASAVEKKDAAYIQEEAVKQVQAGADVLDVNVGSRLEDEPTNMEWAVKVIQEVADTPLCIDSPHPETIKAGFKACKNKRRAWANSITLEKGRIEGILPLTKEYQSLVVALCMDKNGIPGTVQGRVQVAKKIAEVVSRYGIPKGNLYLDALIEPVAIDSKKGILALDTIRELKTSLPEAKTIICLSAVSFGLPERRLLNRTFLPFLMEAGLDAIILDTVDRKLMTVLKATQVLLDKDENCLQYIAAFRAGELAEGR